MDFEKSIYSHTHAKGPFGSKEDGRQNLQFIGGLEQAIFAEFKKGTSFGEVTTAVKLPQYKGWAMYDTWLPLRNL